MKEFPVQAFLNRHPGILKKVRNFTNYHFHKDNVDLIDKIDEELKRKGDEIGKHIMTEKDAQLTERIQKKIDTITVRSPSS
jgi:hypothetical protein